MTNVLEDVGETCWFQIHDSRRSGQSFSEPGYRSITDRANVAQLLGKDHSRTQPAQERLIDRVDRPLLAQRAAHLFIHFFARESGIVHRTTSHARTRVGFNREIALVRNADHIVHQSERSCDLSRGRQERNNPTHE